MPSASPELPQPWDTFLAAVDALLPDPVELHCLGGFVVAVRYHLPRPTGDLDYIARSGSAYRQTRSQGTSRCLLGDCPEDRNLT